MDEFVSTIAEAVLNAIATLTNSVVGLLLLAVLIYPVCQFYWSRIIGCGLLLLVWGAASIAAPLYLRLDDFSHGNISAGLFTLIISSVLIIPFWVAATGAINWAKTERLRGRLEKMPWNAR